MLYMETGAPENVDLTKYLSPALLNDRGALPLSGVSFSPFFRCTLFTRKEQRSILA